MDLKVKDVAELLKVSESKVNHWVKDHSLPAYQMNGQFRFSRNEIEEWVINQKKTHGIAFFEDDQTEKGAGGNKQYSLFRALNKGQVIPNLNGTTKEEVIRSTTKIISNEMNLDAEVLSELLIDREQLQPTALNNGIGIPHTRDFLLSEHYDVVTVVFPKVPLEYGALDGKPVHTLFFLFASDDKRHLNLLAKIAHLSSNPEATAFFQTKPSKEQFLEYVKNWESKL